MSCAITELERNINMTAIPLNIELNVTFFFFSLLVKLSYNG